MKNPLLKFLIKFAPDTGSGASSVSSPGGGGSAPNEPTADELAAFDALEAELAASEVGADESQETPGDDLEGESGAGNAEDSAEDPDEDTQPGEGEEEANGPGDGQEAKEGEESAPAKPEGETETPDKPEEVDLSNVDPDTIEAPKAEEFEAAVIKWQETMAGIDREVDGRVGVRISALNTAEKNIDEALQKLEASLFDEELGKERAPTIKELDRRTELMNKKATVQQKIRELEDIGEELKQNAKNLLTVQSMAKADKRFQHPGISKAHKQAVEEGLRFKTADHLYRYCYAAWQAENGGKKIVKPDVAGAKRAAEEAAIKRKAAGTISTGSKGAGSKSKAGAAAGAKSSDPAWVRNIIAETTRLKKEVA